MPDRLILLFSLLIVSPPLPLRAQSVEDSLTQRYRAAVETLKQHTPFVFLHDGSTAAIHAQQEMGSAVEDAVVHQLAVNPGSTASQIGSALCRLWAPSGLCTEQDEASQHVLALAPHLFLVSVAYWEVGTVFVVGMRDGTPAVLWSMPATPPQRRDPRGYLAAWRPERASESCRAGKARAGTCGPLYADLMALPSDAQGRQRFVIDAGYAQQVGATIAQQTSIWSWNGQAAELQWIGRHIVMVGQRLGLEFADGTLTIGEKYDFRTFYSCGSCEGRQLAHRLKVTPTGVQDLGWRPTQPELELVDELFSRLAQGRSTASLANPQVAEYLRTQILPAIKEWRKAKPNDFSLGMFDDSSLTQTGAVKHLCFVADEIGRLDFKMEKARSGRDIITGVTTQSSDPSGICAQPEKDPADPPE